MGRIKCSKAHALSVQDGSSHKNKKYKNKDREGICKSKEGRVLKTIQQFLWIKRWKGKESGEMHLLPTRIPSIIYMHEEADRSYDSNYSKEQPWRSNSRGCQEETIRSCSQRSSSCISCSSLFSQCLDHGSRHIPPYGWHTRGLIFFDCMQWSSNPHEGWLSSRGLRKMESRNRSWKFWECCPSSSTFRESTLDVSNYTLMLRKKDGVHIRLGFHIRHEMQLQDCCLGGKSSTLVIHFFISLFNVIPLYYLKILMTVVDCDTRGFGHLNLRYM